MRFPPPAVQPLRGGPALRWGVAAPGEIADDFTAALHRHSGQHVAAVASRSAQRAALFAERHGIDRAHEGYDRLMDDAGVDIVYVAAPNHLHAELALQAIAAGKHVLVEKPLATTAADGSRIAAAAAAAGVFAAEAMWTAYLPQTAVLRRLIADGALGEVRLATADVGWAAGPAPGTRFVDPALGGGTLLDAGVYGFWFAQDCIGAPEKSRTLGSMRSEGVDEQAVTVMQAGPRVGVVTSTLAGTNTGLASVVGTIGSARFLDPFVFPARMAVSTRLSDAEWEDPSPLRGREGLAWQAASIAQAVHDGLRDSPVHPLRAAIAVLASLDRARKAIAAEEGRPG